MQAHLLDLPIELTDQEPVKAAQSRDLRMFARRESSRQGPLRPSSVPTPISAAPVRIIAQVRSLAPVIAEPPSITVDAPLPTSVPPIQPSGVRRVALETEIVSMIEAPARAYFDETIEAAFRRKESELRDLFAQLVLVEALALHDRLANPRPEDLLASQFNVLLNSDRRARLITFLADARRRDALGSARRK